jgi:hypothetical protein
VLDVVLGEAVAVEGVEQLDGLLCGAIGEVVDGEDGHGARFGVELDQGCAAQRATSAVSSTLVSTSTVAS